MPRVTPDDEGKTVINPVGDDVGIVEVVEDGVAYVTPHPDWSDRIKAQIGWEDEPDMTEQPLADEHIADITDEQIILRQDLQIDQTST